MLTTVFDYASPSAFQSDRDRATLDFAADRHRPVRFVGRVNPDHAFLLRTALRALGGVVWAQDTWWSAGAVLDPVVTVHPDRILIETFSGDASAYAVLIIDPAVFTNEGETVCGTTNIDFTAFLWAALGEMRSGRETWLRIETAGVEVQTRDGGGRFERRVELPRPWLQGFLQVQAAMAHPGTHLTVRPVDLVATLRFLRYTKAKMSPRALRYELLPGADAAIVLEPWEERIALKGAAHEATESRIIRTWGRRRLRLLEPVLPFADRVEVFLKGRALPSFYAVHLPGMVFVLGLTGWTENKWSAGDGFATALEVGHEAASQVAAVEALLVERRTATILEAANASKITPALAAQVLTRLCRQGKVTMDLDRRAYRYRPLLATPIDEAAVFPPSARHEEARSLVAEHRVRCDSCQVQETRKRKRLPTPAGPRVREIVFHDWLVRGSFADRGALEIVVDATGRIIFGTCGCPFFDENLLNRGPCAHMLALHRLSEPLRRDLPVSQPTDAPLYRRPSTDEGGTTASDDDNDGDENE